jgi:hypothetical protein
VQVLAPRLQVLLELLDKPDTQQQLGLAEVHVSLATLEEVFLAVVKQVRVCTRARHGAASWASRVVWGASPSGAPPATHNAAAGWRPLLRAQAEQDYAALHGQTVCVQLPASGQQLELPVGQEVAVDPTTGHVYAVSWAQDEWGQLAVAGVRELSPAEQQRYWSSRHLMH